MPKEKKEQDPLEMITKAVSMSMTRNVTIQAEGELLNREDGILTIGEKKERLKVRVDPEYTSITLMERDAETGDKETKNIKLSDLELGERVVVNCYYSSDRSEWSAVGVTIRKTKE